MLCRLSYPGKDSQDSKAPRLSRTASGAASLSFMKFRTGLVIGLGVGYYLGAKAGRERYNEMQRWIRQARDSDVIETASDKAKAVIDLTVERARDLIDRGDEDYSVSR